MQAPRDPERSPSPVSFRSMMRSVSLSLAALARSASDLHRPLGRLNTPSGQICPLDSLSLPNQWPWMHGARCGPIVDEVAVPCGWWGEAKGPVTVAADRFAHIVVFEPWGEGLRLPANAEALAVDATLRLLGVSTPPPDETPVELSNTFWLDQLLEICLISPLGEPPPWPILAALHPCATRASIPGLVRHERGSPLLHGRSFVSTSSTVECPGCLWPRRLRHGSTKARWRDGYTLAIPTSQPCLTSWPNCSGLSISNVFLPH